MRKLLILALGLFVFGDLQARTVNYGLKEQVEKESTGFLPQGSSYSLKSIGTADNGGGVQRSYYHSYIWTATFLEVRPTDFLDLNLKALAYTTSYSYGYTGQGGFFPFIGATLKPGDFSLFEQKTKFWWRFGDLDRETLAAGLTIDDKELSGNHLALEQDVMRLSFIWAGTGGYDVVGDLHYIQLDAWRDLIGIYTYEHRPNAPVQEHFDGFFSRKMFDCGLGYRTEVATRNQAWAKLIGVDVETKLFEDLSVQGKFQYRKYQNGFTDNIVVQQDYLSPETEDKSFTNINNLLYFGSGMDVLSARAKLEWKIASRWTLISDNEYVSMQINSPTVFTESDYFFWQAVKICPFQENNYCGFLYTTNKIVNAQLPPGTPDMSDYPYFRRSEIYGIRFHFYL